MPVEERKGSRLWDHDICVYGEVEIGPEQLATDLQSPVGSFQISEFLILLLTPRYKLEDNSGRLGVE